MAKIKSLRVSSDKSISHRAVILSSLATGKVRVKNVLFSGDTMRSIKAMGALGVDIRIGSDDIVVTGNGKYSLSEPNNVIDLGNSGTSMRLISGVLAANEFFSVLTGDVSLRNRPMNRIIEPLSNMGAVIFARRGGYAPLAIKGKAPRGIEFKSKVASAQVKSSILLCGLYTSDDIVIIEPYKSRNHTENMLKAFGVDVIETDTAVSLGRNRDLVGGFEMNVPADISSAAFFMVFAALKKGFELILADVGLNPTRSGILSVFDMVGIEYEILNERIESFERVGDVLIKYTEELKPFTIDGALIPKLIDEIPILSILAIFCDGTSVVKGALELRKKESDRIASICENLNAVGVKTEEFSDGFMIFGNPRINIRSSFVDTHYDHRIAMSFSVLQAVTEVNIKLSETRSILTSYPNFMDHLNYLSF